MALDIFFHEDITDRLRALAQANDRALALAERYGMDREAANLCKVVYAGALADVGQAFGLVLTTQRKEVAQRGPMRGPLVSADRSVAKIAEDVASGADPTGRGAGRGV